jgi:hypothetical protein
MFHRRTATKVRNGRVQKKNNHSLTRLNGLHLGLSDPGKGYRHVTSKEDVWRFLRLIPNWKRLSSDLDLIYLTYATETGYDGWYDSGGEPQIVLCPWPESLMVEMDIPGYKEHEEILHTFGVTASEDEFGINCQFTPESARAYQLLHIFLHELGHHEHRMTKGRGRSGREKYAEEYAIRMQRKLWKQYCDLFSFRPKPGSLTRSAS